MQSAMCVHGCVCVLCFEAMSKGGGGELVDHVKASFIFPALHSAVFKQLTYHFFSSMYPT